MAGAKGRLLNEIRGLIENTAPHYAFTKNGKQFIGCVRKGWCTELKSEAQKINALRFAYATAASNVLSNVFAAGESVLVLWGVGFTFQIVNLNGQDYFFDDSLFTNVNVISNKYFGLPLFVEGAEFNEGEFCKYKLNPALTAAASAIREKTSLKTGLFSWLYSSGIDGAAFYKDLAGLSGTLADPEELPDIYEGLGVLPLDLWRWCKVPVFDELSAENYDELKRLKKKGYCYYETLPAYAAEREWRN